MDSVEEGSVMSDLSVTCTLWVGPHNRGKNRVYSPIYISRLKDMLLKHTISHKDLDFVCFSNLPKSEFREDIRVIPLQEGWPVWWAKLECFRPGVDLERRILALDIDQLIVGHMDSIIDFPATLALSDYWGYSHFDSIKKAIESHKKKRDCKLIPIYSSDAIVYNRGECDTLFTEFKPEYMYVYCGDQDWVAACLGPTIRRFPRSWGRKISKRDRGDTPLVLGDTKLIACHPVKNHQLREYGYIYADRIWCGDVPC